MSAAEQAAGKFLLVQLDPAGNEYKKVVDHLKATGAVTTIIKVSLRWFKCSLYVNYAFGLFYYAYCFHDISDLSVRLVNLFFLTINFEEAF